MSIHVRRQYLPRVLQRHIVPIRLECGVLPATRVLNSLFCPDCVTIHLASVVPRGTEITGPKVLKPGPLMVVCDGWAPVSVE